MRTKTVLLSAVCGLIGSAAAMAQSVYSVNAVGYINVTCPPGYSMIANQLNASTNTIYSLLANAVPGCQFFKYGNGGYTTFTFDEFDLVWYPANDPAATLAPGEGGFFSNPTSTNITFTMVGEVVQGALKNSLPVGFSIRSSIVPQAGLLSDLGLPGAPGDQVFQYANGEYKTFTFDEFDLVWYPAPGPSVNVGESVFLFEGAQKDWNRTFNVNQ